MTTELKTFNWIDDGRCDMQVIVDNMETLRDAIDEVERLRTLMVEDYDQYYPLSITSAVESFGEHTIVDKGQRAEMKLTHCHIVAGGVGDTDTTITVLKNGVDELCDPIVLKSTENTGKLKIGNVVDYQTISQFDSIVVKSDSSRKIEITVNFGGI